MRPIQLDERLSLAASLYTPCELGADIGTDHGLLPCRLLEDGICKRMILSDVSPKAIEHARIQVEKRGLQERTAILCADGLDALTEPAQCVSIMGMGGRTIAAILRGGADKLAGADLICSAHTELPEMRRAIADAGYHLVQERLCRAAGRWYVFVKAVPGAAAYSPLDLAVGPLLRTVGDPLLKEYAAWRVDVLLDKLHGLQSASVPSPDELAQTEETLAAYRAML